LSEVSLNNVDSSMRLFVKDDMFKRREVSNMVFFKPNLENEALLKIFEYLELEKKKEFYHKNKKISRLLQKYTEDIVNLSNKKIPLNMERARQHIDKAHSNLGKNMQKY